MAKAERLHFFLLYLILFFTLKPTKKTLGPAGNRAWPTNLKHHNPAHYIIVALAGGSYFSILPNPFIPLWNQPKSARGPAGNRSLEERKRLGRIKNVKAFSDGHGNLLFNRFLAFSSPVTLRTQQP